MKKNIIITIIGTIIILLSINSNESNNNAFALTYSNNVDLEYTFAPTLDVSFSSNNGSSFNGFVIEDLAPGTANYSNTVTIIASSNNSDGFNLSATVGKASSVDSYRNNSRLVHSNNTSYFESIATNANLTLEELGSNGTTNEWGYAICTTITNSECSTWSNYNGLPAVGTAENPTVGTTLAETTSAGSTSVDMRIAASSTNTQVSGTFTNDINFTITANIVTYSYSITYNGNNSSTIANMPTNVTNASIDTGDTIQLSSNTPTISGIDFYGWCDGTVNSGVCTGTLYQPGDYIKLTNTSSSTVNNIVLTAAWEVTTVTIADGGNMQDISSKTDGGCPSTLTEGQAYTVTDTRDGKSYRVARLADGNCWMLDNLALDITAVSLDTLKGNTNADDTSLTYLKNGGGSSPYATAGVSKAWTSSPNYYDKPMIAVDSTTSGPCNDAYCVNGGSAGSPWSYDSVTSVTINNVTSVAQGKIGVYYNYCAASAGYYCYASGAGVDNPDGTITLQDSKYDICPKGWRLPTSTSSGEFQTLYTAYNNNYTNFQTALSTPLSGYFRSGKAYYQGNIGYFWSSTWNVTSSMHYLRVYSSGVDPSNIGNRSYGYSVRCILAE